MEDPIASTLPPTRTQPVGTPQDAEQVLRPDQPEEVKSTSTKAVKVSLVLPTLLTFLRMGGLATSMSRFAGVWPNWCLFFFFSCFVPILTPHSQVSPQRTNMIRTRRAKPVACRISKARFGGVDGTWVVCSGTSSAVSAFNPGLDGLFLSFSWSVGRIWGPTFLVGTSIVVVAGLAEVEDGAAVEASLVGLVAVSGAATLGVAVATGVDADVVGVDFVVHLSGGLVVVISVSGVVPEEVDTRMVVVDGSNRVVIAIVAVEGGTAVVGLLSEVVVDFEGMVCPPKARLDVSDSMVVTSGFPVAKLDG